MALLQKGCVHCGVRFETANMRRKFCNRDCSKRSRRTPQQVIKKCIVCRKPFDASGRKHRRVVCGSECWKAVDRHKHAIRHPNAISLIGPLRPKQCFVCGSLFISFRASAKNCGLTCRSKVYRNGDAGRAYRLSVADKQSERSRFSKNNQLAAASSTLAFIHVNAHLSKGDFNNDYQSE